MSQFELTLDARKRLQLKPDVAKVFGETGKVTAIVNAETVLLVRTDETGKPDYDLALRSLNILKEDLELRRDRADKDTKTEAEKTAIPTAPE